MKKASAAARFSIPASRWKSVPSGLKQTIKRGLKPFRLMTGQLRCLPDFIIIGAPRCGTTSLYNYLRQHPCVASAFTKEVHFFDMNFKKGLNWYRAHFPTFLYRKFVKQVYKLDLVVGEASPAYLWYPHAPSRILKTVPRAKLIAMFRNPVDQMYSHYQLNAIKWGKETCSFEEAIEKEEDRVRGEMKKMREDENYWSEQHSRYSYLSNAIYIDQLRPWLGLFPREQILIIKSEDFYNDPKRIFTQVLEFLNLPIWELKDHTRYFSLRYPEMEPATRKRLLDYFEPHNQRLYEYVGVNFGWDS